VVEIVCEVIVKDEARGPFELAFGPGGAWGKRFARAPGFRGTTLLRDTRDPRRYLVIDLWDGEAQHQQALAERQAESLDLAAALAGWTESRTELGVFRLLAEATVRPAGRAGRSQARFRD
jgi:quinol monooxygenase YgiN